MSASEIQYFEFPELPGQKRFRCGVLSATLAVGDCAKRWLDAKHVGPESRLHRCRGCPLGAVHAGHADEPQAFKSKVCARCTVPSFRLIKGNLCPSCYNRERELRKGAVAYVAQPRNVWNGDDAKRRTHVVQTFRARCGVIDSHGPRIFEADVAHPLELHIRAMRSSSEPVRLCFVGPYPGPIDEYFGGMRRRLTLPTAVPNPVPPLPPNP